MEQNGVVDSNVAALAELIRTAKLTDEQRRSMLRMSIGKDSKPGEARNYHHGPFKHCKADDRVTVQFPDGSSMVMSVYKAGVRSLRLMVGDTTAVRAGLKKPGRTFFITKKAWQAQKNP